jgi:hypothetical protein
MRFVNARRTIAVIAEIVIILALVTLLPKTLAEAFCDMCVRNDWRTFFWLCGHTVIFSHIAFSTVCIFTAIAWLLYRFGNREA